MQPARGSHKNQRKERGERLRQARRDKELTIHQVSLRTEIPYNNIGAWERGNRDPTLEHLRTLCEALGVDINWVLYGDGLEEEEATHSKRQTQHEQQLLQAQAV